MGHDEIANIVLRQCSHTFSLWLVMIFQPYLTQVTYPKTWKTGEVTPTFREGNKADVTCFRPISLLSCCWRVSEEIFDSSYELVRHQLDASQYGFGKNFSATLQLLLFLDKLFVMHDDDTHDRFLTLCLLKQNFCYESAWSFVQKLYNYSAWAETCWKELRPRLQAEFFMSKSMLICLPCKM